MPGTFGMFKRNNRKTMQERIDQIQGKLEGMVGKKYANRTLDANAKSLRSLIKTAGVNVVRTKYINATEKEIKELVAKGKTDVEILQPCIDSPNYQLLLTELGMDMENLKYMVREARKSMK